MNTPLILGIDSSAYTTSLALVSISGRLWADARKVLTVPAGNRGLRQSDALYQHIKNLPLMYDNLFKLLDQAHVYAVCVSTTPRPAEGSFMPVFLAGTSIGHCTAAALKVPLWEATHQEAHIWAALWSLPACSAATLQTKTNVLAIHLSGGTTEALLVQPGSEQEQQRLQLDLVGATQDLSAGQFIDRVGVSMGLPFPAGPHLEGLAQQGEGTSLRLPVAVAQGNLSFSGPESAAQRAIAAGFPAHEVAQATYVCIAETLARWISSLLHTTHADAILLSGGVASSLVLLTKLRGHKLLRGTFIACAGSEYSSDNAVGLGAWGAARHVGSALLSLPERGMIK